MENMDFSNLNNENNNQAPRNSGAPREWNKKLIWGGVVLGALILTVGGWQYWQYTHSVYYQQMKAIKTLEKFYADDEIGGKTPEETLSLYTDAIKKGDIDSALKYVGGGTAKDEVKKQLLEYKNLGKFQVYTDLLIKAKLSPDKDLNWNPDDALYEVLDENGRRILAMYIYKTKTGIWKIREI